MKSIRKKITVCLMATVLIALLAVGGTSIALNYRSTVATVDQMLSETAVLAAERVEQELTAYKNVATDTGCVSQLSDRTNAFCPWMSSAPSSTSAPPCTASSGATSSARTA